MRRTDLNEKARLIALAMGIYQTGGILSIDKDSQDAACRRLNTGVLSLKAIGAIVGVSVYRVEKALGDAPRPTARGSLNPEHLRELGYLVSLGKVTDPSWLINMLNNGTDLSTIVSLTGLSRTTIWRATHG